MEDNKRCLVIAYKFNDIFYSVNTPEFINSEFRFLLIVDDEIFTPNKIPFENQFNDKLIISNINSSIGLVFAIFKITVYFKNFAFFDFVFTSNPRLLITQFIVNKLALNIILIEDGVMNYKSIIYVKYKYLKLLIQTLLGLDEHLISEKIISTYLLLPHKAVYYFSTVKLLDLKILSFDNSVLLSILEGKRIFVGGCYYLYDHISLTEYSELVNTICKRYGIDYYIPHRYSVANENINCNILDLNNYNLSIEMFASKINNLYIYSLGSSVLFSVKVINPNIYCMLVNAECYSSELKEGNTFLEFYCDKVIEI